MRHLLAYPLLHDPFQDAFVDRPVIGLVGVG